MEPRLREAGLKRLRGTDPSHQDPVSIKPEKWVLAADRPRGSPRLADSDFQLTSRCFGKLNQSFKCLLCEGEGELPEPRCIQSKRPLHVDGYLLFLLTRSAADRC